MIFFTDKKSKMSYLFKKVTRLQERKKEKISHIMEITNTIYIWFRIVVQTQQVYTFVLV